MANSNNNNYNVMIHRLPPFLRKNFEELALGEGPTSKNIKIKKSSKNNLKQKNQNRLCDANFILEIPYAGRVLEWEIYFNEQDYKIAPEFYFHDETFLYDPIIEDIVENVPSLLNWNLKNPKILSSVLSEFVSLFKHTQLEKFQSDLIFSKLYVEYNELITEVSEDNIELLVDNKGGLIFFISIAVDFSSLPIYLLPSDSDQLLSSAVDTATLKLHFHKPDSGRVSAELQFTARLEQVIGSSSILHIPAYSREKGLVEYVKSITDLLSSAVKAIESRHQKKMEYISALIMQKLSVVEYDNVQFAEATLLCEVEKFYCIVTINLGTKFPFEKPHVVLHSVFHMQFGKPFNYSVNNYPYSPRWSAQEMVNRLLKELLKLIPKFKSDSQAVAKQQKQT